MWVAGSCKFTRIRKTKLNTILSTYKLNKNFLYGIIFGYGVGRTWKLINKNIHLNREEQNK